MHDDDADQLFELALDLPPGERERLLQQVAAERPALAARLRGWLADPAANRDFACRTEPDPTLDTLHHVALQVEDIPRAVAFYRTTFGCTVEYEDASWAMLRFGNARLALVLPGQHPPHVAIVRADARSFGRLTGHRDGTRSIYIVDPWGNSIEVLDASSLPGG